ncbi:hypothetical protein NEICINOT_04874 [Neisseria cinerea ATCC 14685]|uniref:Uncharacterized protein n=1 Tax=Neisseria cinerea ATCC 14685 TaxID=546262 RepID=D0W5B9_NEICI|nr:hypothetical protein NEICINOT_04874 [Neisseria cinerea ATCC 14685]
MVYGLDYRVRNVSAASLVRSVCGLRCPYGISLGSESYGLILKMV